MHDEIQVKFYDNVEDERIHFVVIVAKYQDTFVWVKHKQRSTLEIPGGHREQGERLDAAARRELEEETGALQYTIEPVCNYSVIGKTRVNASGIETFGRLYYAHIERLGTLCSEIECVCLYKEIPTNLTYPLIQPLLYKEVQRRIHANLTKSLIKA